MENLANVRVSYFQWSTWIYTAKRAFIIIENNLLDAQPKDPVKWVTFVGVASSCPLHDELIILNYKFLDEQAKDPAKLAAGEYPWAFSIGTYETYPLHSQLHQMYLPINIVVSLPN